MHTGTHKPGNQAFRRFRNTFLRNYTECPGGLYKYWLGHADKDMSDLYDKIKEDIQFRKKWSEQCGLTRHRKEDHAIGPVDGTLPYCFPQPTLVTDCDTCEEIASYCP